jgi:hypothetical protein
MKLCAAVLICFFLAGCLQEALPPGVVAIVNGRPIHLRLVEARHDAENGSAQMTHPSVESLTRQYGAILAEMIVQELVLQELERMDMAVIDEDVDRFVETVRADYPADDFERMIREEHVVLPEWRALLRYMLGMKRFSEQVLLPGIRLTPEEIGAYYQAHLPEFFVLPELSFLVLTSTSRQKLRNAAEIAIRGGGWNDPDVLGQRVSLRQNLVPDVWRDDVARLAVGKATPVREVEGLYQCLVLEEKLPARRLTPVEAYPRIEQALKEQKQEQLFYEWLHLAEAGARIRIAGVFVQDAESETRNARPRPPILDLRSPAEDDPLNSEPIVPEDRPENEPDNGLPVPAPPEDGPAQPGG